MSFKQKRIFMKTFVRSQLEVMLIYEFKKKANSYEDISCVSVSSYRSLWVSNKSEFLRIHFLGLSLKLRKFQPKWILMKTFVESQFEVVKVYQFQTKANSYETICWVSFWSYVGLWPSNKGEFLWKGLLTLNLRLCKFINFKAKRIFKKAFVGSQFEVI